MSALPSYTPVQRGPIFPRNRLATGEVLLWEGRPSSIVYFFQPLVLFIVTILFGFTLFLSYEAVGELTGDVLVWVALVLLLLLMPLSTFKSGIAAMVVAIAVVVVDMVGLFDNGIIAFLPVAIGLFAFLYDYIVWSHTAFAITDRRIMTQYGVFNLRFGDTRHDRISNVTVNQTLFERIFRYGDVMFSTSGETGGIDSNSPALRADQRGAVMWEDIPRPFEVRKKAEDAILRPPQQTVVYQTVPAPLPVPPPAPATAPGPIISATEAEERLVKLQELREKNLISPEEYESKRREIISRM